MWMWFMCLLIKFMILSTDRFSYCLSLQQMFEQQMKQSFLQICTKLKFHLLASNILFTFIPLIVNNLLEKFTAQYLLYFKNENVFSYAIQFDGIHYMYNNYQREINFAFPPGFVFVKTIYQNILTNFVAEQKSILVFSLILTNKILNVISCYNLYHIARHLTQSKKIAEITAIVFIYNPASIFYHVVYSESLYACLTFYAIRLYLDKEDESLQLITSPLLFIKHNLKSLLVFTCASTIRTTGLFLSLVYGVPILLQLYRNIIRLDFNKAVKTVFTGALTLSFFIVFFIGYLYYGYRTFCIEPPYAKFCSNAIPNIYAFIEQEYWRVGFLQYYNMQHIVPIYLGLPSLIIPLLTLSFELFKSNRGLTLAYWVLLYITIFYANIQSSARFFSSQPIYLISIAQFLVIRDKKRTILQTLVLIYLCAYNSLGLIFFTTRFMWT